MVLKSFGLKRLKKIKLMLRIDRAFFFVLKSAPYISVFSFLIVIVLGFLPLANLYILKLIVDRVAVANQAGLSRDFLPVLLLVGTAGCIAVFTSVLSHLSAFLTKVQGLKVSDYVFNILHKKSTELDLSYYENPKFYDILYRAQQEGPYRPQKIVSGLVLVLQNFISICVVSGLLFTIHWIFALVILFAALPSLFVRFFYSGKMYDWFTKKTEKEREAAYLNWLLTGYPNAKDTRLFDLGDHLSKLFFNIKGTLRKQETQIFGKRTLFESIASFISSLLVFGALGFISVRTIKGSLTIGEMVMFFQAFQKGLNFLKSFFSGVAELYEDNLFISYFYKFMDLEPVIYEKKEAISFSGEIKDSIEFKNVNFTYPGSDKKVLKNISLKINKGSVCAIVGENGAGKSTLVKLLARLYDPDSGQILIDSVDIRDYKLKDLRKNIGVMLQDFAKFHFSAKENIGLGDVDTMLNDIHEIQEASIKGGAHDFISKLSDGYSTNLGKLFKNGTELSQGEWQKIAISRTFLKQADILAFDEPASSLDAESEFEIFNRIKTLLNGKTALIISHRFSTVKSADKIIVLNNGEIKEEGNHDYLKDKKGVYKRWYDKQMVLN